MTPKQSAFVDEYLVDFNATQAAVRAGYSERSAYNLGYQALQHPQVKVALEARMAALGVNPAAAGVGIGKRTDAAPGGAAPEGTAPEGTAPEGTSVEAGAEAARPRGAAQGSVASSELSQGWVLGQLVEIVERCMREVPVRDRAGRETGEWTFKPREALAALTLVGKHLGMFSARLDVRFLREQAEAVAAEYGLDPDEVIVEAQRWLQGRRS